MPALRYRASCALPRLRARQLPEPVARARATGEPHKRQDAKSVSELGVSMRGRLLEPDPAVFGQCVLAWKNSDMYRSVYLLPSLRGMGLAALDSFT
jgi:hypothetical protein